MSYSIDLRERVIIFIDGGGLKKEASKIFGVSLRAIYRWLNKKTATGTLQDPPPKRGWKKLEPTALQAYVKQHPDLLLADYGRHFGASAPSVCLAFKRLKITRKKRRPCTQNETQKNGQHFWSK